MSLRDRLHEEMTAAMRSGEALRRDTLRMVWSAVYAAEKRDRTTLTDDQALAVLTREVKTRRESVEAYRKGGREDLAATEEAEIAIIAGFLPAPLSEAEIDVLVGAGIAATGAASARDLGKVMAWLGPRTRGRADGRVVSGLVAEALARADLAAHDEGDHGGGGRG
ncbi:MAG TPA: GatB/YqeY domain-containing protein [Patescibacteria group bacterium]|nr:GatB/YqeY domain-containing protein [Patescibacteria group bacterium]